MNKNDEIKEAKSVDIKKQKKDEFLKMKHEITLANNLTEKVEFTYEKKIASAACSYCQISKSIEILNPATIKFKNQVDIDYLLIVIELMNAVNANYQGYIYMGWTGIFPYECDISRSKKHNINETSSNTVIVKESLSRNFLNEKLFEMLYKDELERIAKREREVKDSIDREDYLLKKEQKRIVDLKKKLEEEKRGK